jgi:hypothetical protein
VTAPHPDETKWWFSAAETAFAVLESELGFEIVERHYHFQGNYIVYERSDARFIVEAGSDWDTLAGMLAVGRPGHRHGDDIRNVLGSVDPNKDWHYNSSSEPIDRDAMTAKMKQWATGIVEHLPALVAAEKATGHVAADAAEERMRGSRIIGTRYG